MTVEDVRAVAVGLPRTVEVLVRDRIKFRVGRIVYVAFSRDETVMGFAFPKLERAALVVCNDSAAMHMAVALSRPLVALFGPTDVSHAGPYRRPDDVISHKQAGEVVRHRDVDAARRFMERITVEEVVAKCEERLMRG